MQPLSTRNIVVRAADLYTTDIPRLRRRMYQKRALHYISGFSFVVKNIRTLTGARQVGYVAGPLPNRLWESWATCDTIENSRSLTVLVILPRSGNGAWSGLPRFKL